MEYSFEPAIDAREQLERWDAGHTIASVEMGGLGPGYEQAIQILAIEIVRDELDKVLPDAENFPRDWADGTVARIDVKLPDGTYSCGGFSGAQVGAAKRIAYKWLTIGPMALYAEIDADRRIQVSKFWPRVSA